MSEPSYTLVEGEYGLEPVAAGVLDRDDSIGQAANEPLPDLPDDTGPRVLDWDHTKDLETEDLVLE